MITRVACVATALKGGDPRARGWGFLTSGLLAHLLHLRQGKLGETPVLVFTGNGVDNPRQLPPRGLSNGDMAYIGKNLS